MAKYTAMHHSADGAGYYKEDRFNEKGEKLQSSPWDKDRTWDSEDEAIAFANAEQQYIDKHGNDNCAGVSVYREGWGKIYQAKSQKQ